MYQKFGSACSACAMFLQERPLIGRLFMPVLVTALLLTSLFVHSENTSLKLQVAELNDDAVVKAAKYDIDIRGVCDGIRVLHSAIERIEEQRHTETVRLNELYAAHQSKQQGVTTTVTPVIPVTPPVSVPVEQAVETKTVLAVASPSRRWYYLWLR